MEYLDSELYLMFMNMKKETLWHPLSSLKWSLSLSEH